VQIKPGEKGLPSVRIKDQFLTIIEPALRAFDAYLTSEFGPDVHFPSVIESDYLLVGL